MSSQFDEKLLESRTAEPYIRHRGPLMTLNDDDITDDEASDARPDLAGLRENTDQLGPGRPGAVTQTLFRTTELAVRFVCPPSAAQDTCFVTFDSFTNLETLDRPGFGEGFFESRGIPAIHVVTRRNLWYQEPDLPDALAAAAETARRFDRAIAYGSSMGGYAAIRYGAAAGADLAIAISPQYTIDRRIMPEEARWSAFSASTKFVNEARPFPKVGYAYVFFDPHDLDHRHVERLAQDYPVDAIRLPFAGHPAGAYLAETGLLQAAIGEIRAGTFDRTDFEGRARAARGQSGQYLFTLARLQPLGRMRWKLALAARAVAVAPDDPEYRSYLGLALACADRPEEAEAELQEALRRGGDQPLTLERYGRFLLRMGRVPEAARLLEKAVALGGELPRVRRTYALLLLARARVLSAWRCIRPVLRAYPRLAGPIADEMAAVIAWRLRRRVPRLNGSTRREPRPPMNLNIQGDIRLRSVSTARRT